jgi:poly(A) polymerase
MVIEGRRRLEVTTFRSDLSYSDGRRPDAVKFVSAREDALRRDFTINGMFYDLQARRVVDYVGGQQDLRRGLIRAIGEPQKRFGEDYLRMLRAVRFAERFGFRIDPATAEAIRQYAPRIVQISGERIRDELEKMLQAPSAPRAVRQLHGLGLLGAILPELCVREEIYPSGLRRLEQVAGKADLMLAMAALLADLGRGDLNAVARRWGCSNQMRKALVWTAEHLHDWKTLADAPLADLKRLMAHRQFARLEALWRLEELAATGGLDRCREIRRRIKRIAPAQVAPAPLISGEDLKRLGLEEGPRLGEILKAVYEAQLNEGVLTRRRALRLAREMARHDSLASDDNAHG